MQRIADFFATLLRGGTAEIVLLIVLVVVGLVLLCLALWLAWKLLGLLGKGLQWLFERGGEAFQARSIARREEELSKPPLVATGWGSAGRLGLRVALAEASRLATPDALRLVVVAGEGGFADLCRSLGLSPPGAGRIGIAAGSNAVLIDARGASVRELGRLGRALPWRRPLDGIALLAAADGLPADGISRAAGLARATGVKAALHLVLPSGNAIPAWRPIGAGNGSGDAICSQLAADAVRIWLVGGNRDGFEELARAQSRDLPGSIDRALAVAPTAHLDIASLAFSGAGLVHAAAQAVGRTRPSTTPGVVAGAAYATCALGIVLAMVAALWIADRTDDLRGTLATASREAAVPWAAEGVSAVPNGARIQRLAGIGTRLAEHSTFPMLSPLAPVIPNWSAPRELGGAFLDAYVLRPMGAALEREARRVLVPQADASRWLDDARRVGEWTAAWEGLAEDATEVDIPALLSAAFGGDRRNWPVDVDLALDAADVVPPPPETGGLDVAGLTEGARSGFVLTMQNWATAEYTNGAVARAARRAVAGGATWRQQHAALVDLREALQDPGQQWLTAAEDRSDHASELRLLGRALALGIIGQVATVEAKAEVARIRIDARERVTHFVLPELGVLLERSGQGSGPSLRMTASASAWLMFLDRIANAGFAPSLRGGVAVLPGVVTVDRAEVARLRERLRVFDRFAANVPAEVPPGPAQRLLLELGAETVVGVAGDVERALRRESSIGIAAVRAERRAGAAVAFADLEEIETWLRDRQASEEAQRVADVRARVANGILTAAVDILDEEDPLAVHVDPTADSDALVRRFERGVQHTERIREQFVAPYLETVSDGIGGWVALHWRDISRDLDAWRRGDSDSTISALEGNLRAWAEDPNGVCDAPRILGGRGDYLARTAARFRRELDAACERERNARLMAAFGEVESYYVAHIRDYWPHAANAEAPEVAVASLAEYVRRVHEHGAVFAEVDGSLARLFANAANFWTPDAEGAVVRFRVDWRWRRSEERLAEHVADVRIEGAEVDETGTYTWRYGAPFALHLRMARNSPYRFLQPDGRLTEDWTLAPGGHGALLRALAGLSGGAALFEVDVMADGPPAGAATAQPLRITARLTHADGRGLTIPDFRADGRGGGFADRTRALGTAFSR